MKSIPLLSLLFFTSFFPEAEAFHVNNRLSISTLRLPSKVVPSQHPITHSTSPSSTQIHLKWIESSEEDKLPKLNLSPEEDDAIRAIAKSLSRDDKYGVGWFERPEAWAAAKKEYPLIEKYDDADLREAFIKQKPRLLDVFTETPLGPFILINLIVKFSGFTWCDTPFGQAEACIPK